MKFLKHSTLLLATVGVMMVSCNKQDFVDVNANPDALLAVPPQNQFLNATVSIHSQDFEAFYDKYQRIMPWMQYTTALNGNRGNFTQNYDNFANRYSREYNGISDRLYDIEKLVERLPAEDQPKYVHMISIARILKAYYTFYVSDIYGAIPYTEAFQGRYGGTLQPKYDMQEELFATLDSQIKEAVSTLKMTQTAPQQLLGTYDQYFGGDAQKWVKAGNALRLKIAMRQIKAKPAVAQSIAKEVLEMPAADLMASNEDNWVFKANATFTNSDGNWNAANLRAPKPLVDFMVKTKDPRIDAYFTPNSYSQANIDFLIADKQLPAGTKAPERRYIGSYTDPDQAKIPAIVQRYYTVRTVKANDQNLRVDTLSYIQPRLFAANTADAAGTQGKGFSYFPVITFADFAFMRAEAAFRSYTGESPKNWYETAVTSSLNWYDAIAKGAQLTNYTATTQAEIDAYLMQPEVAYDAAKGLDKIASQAYLHYFKNPSEGWANWKRTGIPNDNSAVPMPTLTNNGATLIIPRRAPIGFVTDSDPNFANKQAAYDAMMAIPGFGKDLQDATGRVWWDKPM